MSALSLCLSRACLGKMMIIFSSMKWHRKRQTRFFRFQLQDLTQLCVDLEHDIGGVLTVALEDVLIDAALGGQAQLLRAETEEKPCVPSRLHNVSSRLSSRACLGKYSDLFWSRYENGIAKKKKTFVFLLLLLSAPCRRSA